MSRTAIASPRAARYDAPFEDRMQERFLLERLQDGEDGAWLEVMQKYEPMLYRFAYSLCKNHADAEDAVSLTLVRLHQNLYILDPKIGFKAWLFRITRNICYDIRFRSPERRSVSLNTYLDGQDEMPIRELPDPSPSPEEQYIMAEQSQNLQNEIGFLPGYQKQALSMYYLEGKNYEEIAKATGSSIGTIKSRLSRARTMLRRRLSSQEGELVRH